MNYDDTKWNRDKPLQIRARGITSLAKLYINGIEDEEGNNIEITNEILKVLVLKWNKDNPKIKPITLLTVKNYAKEKGGVAPKVKSKPSTPRKQRIIKIKSYDIKFIPEIRRRKRRIIPKINHMTDKQQKLFVRDLLTVAKEISFFSTPEDIYFVENMTDDRLEWIQELLLELGRMVMITLYKSNEVCITQEIYKQIFSGKDKEVKLMGR